MMTCKLNHYLISILLFMLLILLGLIYDEEQDQIIRKARGGCKDPSSQNWSQGGSQDGNSLKNLAIRPKLARGGYSRKGSFLLIRAHGVSPTGRQGSQARPKIKGRSKSCDVAFHTRKITKSDVGAEEIRSLSSQATPLVVTCKIYHPVKSQCDDSPFTTADMSKISMWKLNAGKIHWLAVSRDLVSKFPMGCKVRIKGCGKWDRYIWEVHDKTNEDVWSEKLQRRIPIRKQIEILMPLRIKRGKWRNVKVYKVY